jgi:hypothetical protein
LRSALSEETPLMDLEHLTEGSSCDELSVVTGAGSLPLDGGFIECRDDDTNDGVMMIHSCFYILLEAIRFSCPNLSLVITTSSSIRDVDSAILDRFVLTSCHVMHRNSRTVLYTCSRMF